MKTTTSFRQAEKEKIELETPKSFLMYEYDVNDEEFDIPQVSLLSVERCMKEYLEKLRDQLMELSWEVDNQGKVMSLITEDQMDRVFNKILE